MTECPYICLIKQNVWDRGAILAYGKNEFIQFGIAGDDLDIIIVGTFIKCSKKMSMSCTQYALDQT